MLSWDASCLLPRPDLARPLRFNVTESNRFTGFSSLKKKWCSRDDQMNAPFIMHIDPDFVLWATNVFGDGLV
jgi:hypothetical protein